MRKLVLFMVISFVTLGLTLSSGTASAEEVKNQYTPEDYINYLEHYDAQAARESGVSSEYIASAVIDAGKTLKDFKTLSKEEQQKFVDGFSQLETIKSSIGEEKPEKANALASDKGVSYQGSVAFFGAPITTYKVSVNYKVDGGKVKKINSSNAFVVRNLNPVVRTGLNTGGKNAWVTSDNKAAVTGSFYYQIGPIKDVGVTVGNVFVKAVGDKNGKRTYKRFDIS
ncbi:hypothetical protein ABS751_22045 [Bacillus subtilis]|uniref:hypothetical protein n=1 Tax=Bacillus subtilis group TaxID=653685 RepID=UPI000CD30A7C|nr:hypothetical protein [Bacillus subtilis]MEC0398459.1 hypothetical protein [Bacillus subtilis]MEC0434016.1 hypothetical protein [Bacillus subtilis]MEC0469964.1 hypothetical protein [Bacillus subtilis]POD82630.1 hypothetical protein S101384_04361 [Bacillus subtilis subsp. subtilis]